jgi:YD repeat-containing protein
MGLAAQNRIVSLHTSVPNQFGKWNLVTTSLSYDADGNLTSSGNGSATTTYTYDYANRLIALFAGGATTTYCYDAFGTRVLQTRTSTTLKLR